MPVWDVFQGAAALFFVRVRFGVYRAVQFSMSGRFVWCSSPLQSQASTFVGSALSGVTPASSGFGGSSLSYPDLVHLRRP